MGVPISQDVWLEEVERLRRRSPARLAADRERDRLEREGPEVKQLLACSEEGDDGTSLPGLFKYYLPICEPTTSERRFTIVFSVAAWC